MPHWVTCGILVFPPGIEPVPLFSEVLTTARDVTEQLLLKQIAVNSIPSTFKFLRYRSWIRIDLKSF